MMISRKVIIFTIITFITLFTVIFFTVDNKPDGNLKEKIFLKLRNIREIKKKEIIDYFKNIKQIAYGIKNDKKMLSFFKTIRQNEYITNAGLEYEIDRYYVANYGNFYDILFVDSTGYVFQSIKKESDYHTNLFDGFLSGINHEKDLKNSDHYVEYKFYSPSNEPAAFFTIAIDDNSEHIGWFILQCSINSLNSILINYNELGRTGEVYLVNKQKLMLSDSRFMEDCTILQLKVDTRAVKEALLNNIGERIIEDYRGVRVFSSFEKFELFGTTWIIIAEIDEDEVFTEHYKRYKKYFQKEIFRYLADLSHSKSDSAGGGKKNDVNGKNRKKTKRVDMNEFAKATSDSILQSSGIISCTAVALFLPNKFGYLAHISPTDDIYISNVLTGMFLQDNKRDFLGELIKRIMYYNVYPYELKKLNYVIIAPHHNSFENAVDKILESGVELANIRFLYHPESIKANVLLDVKNNSVKVEWDYIRYMFSEYASDVDDLGKIIKRIIKYNNS